MEKEILVNVEDGETRAAVLEDGVLVDIYIERQQHPRYAGNIYKGKVENVLPGMQAAFVNIGLERNAFLYVDDAVASRSLSDDDEVPLPKDASIVDLLKQGQDVIVQITKEPIGTKGARVVTNVTLPGRYVVLMPAVDYIGVSRRIEDESERARLKKIAQAIKPKNMGLIVRTAAAGRDEQEISQDVHFLVGLWRKIQARARRVKAPALIHRDYDLIYRLIRDVFTPDVKSLTIDERSTYIKAQELAGILSPQLKPRVKLYRGPEPIFSAFGIEEEIRKALRRKVWLDCGAYIVIDQTEALTAIDVNTGKYTGKVSLAETVLHTNLEAAVEIARQIRLRNLGGIIIIDFIDMEDPAHRQKVLDALNEALAKDRTKANVLGFTGLGLVEMTRKKVQQGLDEALQKPCPYCEGRGRVLSEETVALQAVREIKRRARETTDEAMLVVMHPSVAAVLIGPGGANLARLEEEVKKTIYVKGSLDMRPEDMEIALTGTQEEVARKALPVTVGDQIEVEIEEQHVTNSRDGIARIEGYVIDVDGAGSMVGKRAKVEIVKVFKTYARAKIVAGQES